MIDGDCQTFVSDCHVRAATELVSHTWDPVVLAALRLGPTRRSELIVRIGGVSDKVLTESLRRLQARALVSRLPDTEHRPPHRGATYRLTPLGESLADGPLAQLAQWAAAHQAELVPDQHRVAAPRPGQVTA